MLTRPALLLRIEEAGLLTGAVLLYSHFHFSWLLFAVLFLAPDLFMLGYLLNPRIGSALYNLGYTLNVPIILFITWLHRKLAAAAGDRDQLGRPHRV